MVEYCHEGFIKVVQESNRREVVYLCFWSKLNLLNHTFLKVRINITWKEEVLLVRGILLFY